MTIMTFQILGVTILWIIKMIKRVGRAITKSTPRIMSWSVNPPRYPAITPQVVPTVTEIATATAATA
jgi:hypothetical protein